ncbi:MAG: uroporphyrinogen-III synthase [Candidatus Aphodosoma sp.]
MKIKNILVSQPHPENGKSPYLDIAEKHNVKVVFRPFIKVDPILSKEFRTQKVNIAGHTAIVFTSRVGIDHFFRLAKELRVPITDDLRYFCISEAVALYLQKYINYRKRKVFYGATSKLADLFAVMGKHPKEDFLVVLPDNDNDDVMDMIRQNEKLHCDVALMYRTVSNDFGPDEQFNYDMILFFSPQGIAALKKNFPEFSQGEIVIGTLGTATAQAATEAGLRVDIPVPSPQYTSMSVAVDAYIKENHKRR